MPAPAKQLRALPFGGYLLATALVGGALALSMALGPILPFSFFLGAVLASALISGTAVGAYATILSIALITLVLKRPPFAMWTAAEFPPRIITFAISSVVLLFLSMTRRRAEDALQAANSELRKWAAMSLIRTRRRARRRLIRARLEARLEERTRLAREIHDTLLQGFTGVSLQILAAMGQPEVAPDCRESLTSVLGLAQKTLADARQAVWDMRPAALEGDDFAVSLRAALDRTIDSNPLAFDFVVRGEPRPLPNEVETVIFRVAQEAVTNVVKHAAADYVRVVLIFKPRSVGLIASDDGRGFAVEASLQPYGGRWGLLGMRERASQVRGSFSIDSAPGKGTKVRLVVPLRRVIPLPNQGMVAASAGGSV
jgi:signal transduction histidine kinase